MPYLVGDIGGTNARFARAGRHRVGPVTRLATHDFAGPLEAIRSFLERDTAPDAPRAAALGWAGPVEGPTARLTNAGWTIDTARLAVETGIGDIVLINDFRAVAWALPDLSAADLHRVGDGRSVAGAPLAVLGAGTGLGVAACLPGPDRTAVVGGEGGHVTMPACTDDEARMLAAFRRDRGHVSAETLLSGDGLVRLHDWFNAESGGTAPDRDAAAVTAAAAQGCPVSGRALDTFCAMFGTVAGNLALTLGARGGVYIAGGIIPRMREYFAASQFRARFEAKGRYESYMKEIPTWIVLHPEPAFLGLVRLLRDRDNGRPAGR